MTDYQKIICCFYPEDNSLRRLLITHSTQVANKAVSILSTSGLNLDQDLVVAGAMLHDIGIFKCQAPTIFCKGEAPYIAHGVIGGTLLRQYDVELELFARICERHTGSGLTKADIIRQKLPIPWQDYLPETPVEKLICLADKFFSKSGDLQEKKLDKIRVSMEKFGSDSLQRFDMLCQYFGV